MARRELFLAAGATGLAAPALAAELIAQAAPDRDARLADVVAANRFRIDRDRGAFSGPGWDRLLAAGRSAHFFLIGEEHGIAENPEMAAALFSALVPAGYARLGIEISPPMATELDGAAANGPDGIRELFADPGARVAFFGMREEAEMIAAVRRAVPGRAPVLWGMDYEVVGDRRLVALLAAARKPASAEAAFADLARAQQDS